MNKNRPGFEFYVIECRPCSDEEKVRYYGEGGRWFESPHEAVHYKMQTWVEKRIKTLVRIGVQDIKLLTYEAKLTQEKEY